MSPLALKLTNSIALLKQAFNERADIFYNNTSKKVLRISVLAGLRGI